MKKYPALIAFLVAFTVNIYAYDWTNDNVSIVNQAKDEDKTELKLKDETGNEFSVTYYEEIQAETAKNILKLKKNFYEWENMKVDSINFVASEGGLQISVIPKKYEYQGVDYNRYMPSGMLFTYTYALQYNFRITIESLFIRIKGDFSTETDLSKKLADAVKNPQEFVKKRDPEYLLQRIETLDDTVNKMRTALLTLHNSGFFSGPKQIEPGTINRVVDIKKQNPAITVEKILETLEKEKVKTNNQEVKLILNVYFNIFEK